MAIAIIKNGVVENVIAVDEETRQSTINHCTTIGYLCVETDQASPGDIYESGTFSRPEVSSKLIITKLEYMDRFTDTELALIYTAAKSSVQVEVWLEKFKLATEVNLSDPRTISGVQALETAGLLTAGRAAEILA